MTGKLDQIGDFCALGDALPDNDRRLLGRLWAFLEAEVAPIANWHWSREKFPHHLIGKLGELGVAGLSYDGYGCPGRSSLLDGFVALEFARVDPSMATFLGVHAGLAMGSIYLCGSEEQKRAWLPPMARLEKIGAFGLTEPDIGSGASRGLTTTARRDGDGLANAQSFVDTAAVLRMTRTSVAWQAVGCSIGAYERALAYARQREQFGRPIGGFQLVQDLLVRMLGNITASLCMVAQLSRLQDVGRMSEEQASLAKAFCTTKMRETVGMARELMGGNGILPDFEVGRFVADAEAIHSYEGTREMNTLIVGRAITGLSAFA